MALFGRRNLRADVGDTLTTVRFSKDGMYSLPAVLSGFGN